jgi:hypothetical protein
MKSLLVAPLLIAASIAPNAIASEDDVTSYENTFDKCIAIVTVKAGPQKGHQQTLNCVKAASVKENPSTGYHRVTLEDGSIINFYTVKSACGMMYRNPKVSWMSVTPSVTSDIMVPVVEESPFTADPCDQVFMWEGTYNLNVSGSRLSVSIRGTETGSYTGKP